MSPAKKPHSQAAGEQPLSRQNGASWMVPISGNFRRYTSFERFNDSVPSVRPWKAPSKVMPYLPSVWS